MTVAEPTAWSLLPAALERVLAAVAGGGLTVIECGSGFSSVAIARAIAEAGTGRLYALEHDPHWARQTRTALEREGLSGVVELIEAELRPHELAEADSGWYDVAALDRLPAAADLLLVDGPPGALAATGRARYPALPLLASRLAPGAIVILDDIDRAAERWILDRWEREMAIDFDRRWGERVAIGVFSEDRPAGLPGKDFEGKQ